METLRLKPRQPVNDVVDNWDDDDFEIEGDDFTINSQSTSVNTTNRRDSRRDSHSSLRSEFESIHGEEERQVHLPGDDEKSTMDAIAAAARAGIPIPINVPSSALTGGTIKRLGGRKLKKIIQEDWGEDLELPDAGEPLQIKKQDGNKFPDVLRQVSSSTNVSPVKATQNAVIKAIIDLDRFRDNDDDDDLFGDGEATIKVTKRREPAKPISLITPPTPQKNPPGDDDFEQDLELPTDGMLKLSRRRDIPKTPSLNPLDDLDWAEGSLGTRFGGTRREGRSSRSNRSSSISAMSPSVASSLTAESEDEAVLDGLVLPDGNIDFGERMKRRRLSRSPDRVIQEPVKASKTALVVKTPQAEPENDDFLAGLDIGNGDVFSSKKLTLHRNVQLKETRPASPSRPKTAVTLKFTTKLAGVSRLPRPMGPVVSHERTLTQSSLEPVSESGGPIPQPRRSFSRMGHSAQSSITSLGSAPTPTTPSAPQSFMPSTPRRREVNQKTSTNSLRNEPTTTSAQLLRLKRSLPAMKPPQSPARPVTSRGYERPPSRTELSSRPHTSMRPKTPVERFRTNEGVGSQSRKPAPFLPAGATASQSHNVNARNPRPFRRHDSDSTFDFRPTSRAVSRSTMRSPSPRKHRQVERIAQEGPRNQLNKPRRARQFGDGHELDGFDDLPTSTQAEARFLRQPVSATKGQARNRIYQNVYPDRTGTPSPLTPYTPSRVDAVPGFARDTAASRIARETGLAQRTSSKGPSTPLTSHHLSQLSAARSNMNPHPPHATIRPKKSRKAPQTKPHLISNLNPPKEAKMVNGMYYNPETFRWEGNDNILNAFDVPASSPSTVSVPPFVQRDRDTSTPRPALITNIGPTKGVQVVGGMVFDPQNMCWLKHAPQAGKSDPADPMDGFDALEDEDDVFKDIPDLEDRTGDSSEPGHGRVSDIKDEWLVGEEFDVGPEFVRRQREEEERWRKKCNNWFSGQQERDNSWKWRIRDIVNQSYQPD